MSAAKKGHPYWPHKSEESKQKSLDALRNAVIPKETRRRVALANIGKKRSDQARKNMSEAGKRRVQRDGVNREWLEKLWEHNRGRKMDPDAVARSAEKRRGFRHTEEAKQRMSDNKNGIPRSPEATAKAAASNRGRKRSPEFCKRMHEAAIARAPISEETRQKMREGQRRRYAKDGSK
jgi:hypothetical protein